MKARIRELSTAYGLHVDPKAPVWTLAVGERQRVEIIKALYRGAALLILDEPTAVLTPQEVDELFVTLRQMAKDGHSLIFISHKLHEVIDLVDRISVLRDGRLIDSVANVGVTRSELARMMVGREVMLDRERAASDQGDVGLDVTVGLRRWALQAKRRWMTSRWRCVAAKFWAWPASAAMGRKSWPK